MDRRDRRDRRDRKGSEGSPPIVRDRKRSEGSEKLKDGRGLQCFTLGNREIGNLKIEDWFSRKYWEIENTLENWKTEIGANRS